MTPNLKTLNELAILTEAEVHGLYGGKAWGLLTAYKLAIRVPVTWLISAEWYQKFFEKNPEPHKNNFLQKATQFIVENFHGEILKLPDVAYAVRSSSQFEDTSEQSFAGIFESKLHVKKSEIAYAVAKVWASCLSERVKSYFDDLSELKMAVVIQPMIHAKYAGVGFSKHPSPATALENHHTLIEVAEAEGEKIVQGEITPLRFSGNIEKLSATIDERWMNDLLQAMLTLKAYTQHEIDMEFIVDKKQEFYLVQQRPVSTHLEAKILDLSNYFRAYKRSLYTLDIEMLIEGCSQYLANYLEVPHQLDQWMIMTTTPQGTQELWLHKIINQAVTDKVAENILRDEHYLARLAHRYQLYHQRILTYNYQLFFDHHITLQDRLLNWIDFIKPLHAHYYVPMFMIDALSQILLLHMRKIDNENAEKDLLSMGTANVRTLGDFLNEELLQLKKHLPNTNTSFNDLTKEQQHKLRELAKKYGFLKCHQVYEQGYTAEELLSLLRQLEESNLATNINSDVYDKYINDAHTIYIFEQFQRWMNIRNQQMEYLMYAVLSSRPLMEELAKRLEITVKELWGLSKEIILTCLTNENRRLLEKVSVNNLAIFREDGKTRVTEQLKIVYATTSDSKNVLKGKTIFGEGKLTGKVKLAFSPQDLENFIPEKNCVLVTGMTTPDYVPLLKNFAALITDEGGILCHAAIIARELRIPAIVGTGLATEILIEGATVQIDFDCGQVSVIN